MKDDEESVFPTLIEMEAQHVRAALRYFDYDREKTARALGISKVTLIRKIHEYEIGRKDELLNDDMAFELNRPLYAWERD
jgi:DNA-binding NtrC family response regulator